MSQSRAVAAILGGACGDALGVALETFPKSNSLDKIHAIVLTNRISRASLLTDFQAGGPWKDTGLVLQAGEWTDDTAMMLCLADSILATHTIKVGDLMKRFVDWWFTGYNSCNGRSIGLGGNIRKAIYAFSPSNPDLILGGTDPEQDAGNGALMRLAPVPVYWRDDLATALKMARLQTATTHNVQETCDGSALMAFMIWHGINGANKTQIFDELIPTCPGLNQPEIKELAQPNAAWRAKAASQIRTLPGRCLWSLEAAMWCVYNSNSFEEAVIKAVNLHGDADTIGSITGQIAGAIYGVEGLPDRWTNKLWQGGKILDRAQALYARS